MLPTLRPNNIVVALKLGRLQNGDIVVAKVGQREVIKRIADIKNGDYFLVGDNLEASTDSRSYGHISDKYILGKVIFSLKV